MTNRHNDPDRERPGPAPRVTSGDARVPVAATSKSRLGHATEPHILFPAIAILVLAIIWGATLNLISVEQATARRVAETSGGELAETYESQVVRALREIDQTLKFVKYAYELEGRPEVLEQLRTKAMLPPDLLFVVSIADSAGHVRASTLAPPWAKVAEQEDFLHQRHSHTDSLSVGLPQRDAKTGEWILRFSRRLDSSDGSFAGIVTVSVGAAYFVSGYETSKLGEHGVLGVLGTDGVFRARRSGEEVVAGERVDYAVAVRPRSDDGASEARPSTNPWDGVRRYTSARELFDFPLAVIVGLSAEEQLAPTRQHIRRYLWIAFASSLLLVLFVALLGRTSWQLARSRQLAVEEQIAHAARVEYLAYHDGLTTLPNRSLFSKLLQQSIHLAHRHQTRLAVLFLDLDRFKVINDTLGHEAGDKLLQEVAARLKGCLRESDTVARLGGDEFVALLPDLTEEKYVATVAQKILSAIARPFALGDGEFRVTGSIGISTYPHDGLDEQTLTKNADIAMYQAKAQGKNNFQLYSEDMNVSSLDRLNLESRMRHALERGEFELHYQPKRDIRSGCIAGMEALLRWRHPDLGMVAPMQFIPVAEATGLIIPIGKWVLRTACLQNVAWQRCGLPRLSVAVNLTARQFYDEYLLPTLHEILEETGMDPQLLELEISESMLMSNVDNTLRIMTGLKDMGIRIAIDDFGIGYSSLSALKRFPLDTIKVDRSFIRDASSVAEDRDLTEAIMAMGRKLSLTIVAQGVETREQADFLRSNACDEFQGFYVGEPVAADQMAELLKTGALQASREGLSDS
ncbi:MAG: EAL domain-containing protein [Pseudomonadota bacterium]